MLELDEHIDDFQDWIIYAPNATGVVFTLYNVITGGAPIFKFLKGWDIHNLPTGYRVQSVGTTAYERGLQGRVCELERA